MASKNKGGRGNVHYTGKRKYKYVHYIRYIIRKCLRLNLHINGSTVNYWNEVASSVQVVA